jgi:hypothetical protein
MIKTDNHPLDTTHIKLKRDDSCFGCQRTVQAGESAFRPIIEGQRKTVCFACSDPSWRAPGSPFHTRMQVSQALRKQEALRQQETATVPNSPAPNHSNPIVPKLAPNTPKNPNAAVELDFSWYEPNE